MNSANKKQVQILKALASEPRLEILRLLREHPQCVNALAERLRMTQSTVSQYLQLLQEVGLVKAEKRGTWTHYALDSEAMKQHGQAMAKIFGGWIELPEYVDGKQGCPTSVLKECQDER